MDFQLAAQYILLIIMGLYLICLVIFLSMLIIRELQDRFGRTTEIIIQEKIFIQRITFIFNDSLFNEKELFVLKYICEKFNGYLARQIKNLSHKESTWIDNHENYDLIDYDKYGFTLTTI
jgi:uncharacterized phage-associated protein